MVYRYANYIGYLTWFRTSGHYKWNDDSRAVESVQLSPGCKKVKLYDDDWGGGADDKTITSSWSYLDYDLRSDVKAYELWGPSGEEALLSTGMSADDKAKLYKEANNGDMGNNPEIPKAERTKTKPSEVSGCWTCHHKDNPNKGDCWKGSGKKGDDLKAAIATESKTSKGKACKQEKEDHIALEVDVGCKCFDNIAKLAKMKTERDAYDAKIAKEAKTWEKKPFSTANNKPNKEEEFANVFNTENDELE